MSTKPATNSIRSVWLTPSMPSSGVKTPSYADREPRVRGGPGVVRWGVAVLAFRNHKLAAVVLSAGGSASMSGERAIVGMGPTTIQFLHRAVVHHRKLTFINHPTKTTL